MRITAVSLAICVSLAQLHPTPPTLLGFLSLQFTAARAPDMVSHDAASPLVLLIEGPDTVSSGRAVHFRLILKNKSDTTIKLTYGGTGAPDVWIAIRAQPTVAPLWYSGFNQQHTMMATSGSLAPRGSRVFQISWPGAALTGVAVPSGTYYVTGGARAYLRRPAHDIISETKAMTVVAR